MDSWRVLELLALTVLLAVGGWWIALAGSPPPSRPDGSGGQAVVTVSATASSVSTETVTGGHTATPGAKPSATPLATTPSPLMLSPLHLTSIGDGQCAGSQTLHNGGTLTTTWQWVSAQPDLPADFVFGVNSPAQFGGLPANLDPGVTQGGTDTLNVRMACTDQNYKITLRDGFGNSRQVTMTSKR